MHITSLYYRQQREVLSEAEIEEAISNDNISDLRRGPCGGSLVDAYSCFLRNPGADEVVREILFTLWS